MAAGNYTGAIHALKEVVKHAPDHEAAQELLAVAQRHKAEQRTLLLSALLGAIVFIGIGSVVQLPNDFWMLAVALVGLLVGYGVANVINSFRQRPAK